MSGTSNKYAFSLIKRPRTGGAISANLSMPGIDKYVNTIDNKKTSKQNGRTEIC